MGIIIGIILSVIVIGLLICFVVSLALVGKYDYIWSKQENGEWYYLPVYHPCGEEIDEDFIKLWHERKKQHDEEMKAKGLKFRI